LDQAQRDFRATGAKLWGVRLRTSLIDASLHLNRLPAASDLLVETQKLMADTGERMLEAELHRLEGDLLPQKQHLQRTAISDCAVERSYRLAIDVAQRQKAKLWELRASTHLAEFWLEQEKGAAAHALLAPVVCWFTEGPDAPDLVAAQAILDRCKEIA
jgi:predicted ATPase